MGDGASTVVMQDPQGSIVQILRPYSGFEAEYQGVSLEIEVPIAGPNDLGQYVATDVATSKRIDVDRSLARYTSVPKGSTITFWFPIVRNLIGEQDPTITETQYAYTIHWRLRTLSDYRFDGRPWSIPGLLPPGPTGVITEDNQNLGLLVPSARGITIVPSISGGSDKLPIDANGGIRLSNGVFRRNILAPVDQSFYGDAYYEPVSVRALGDEMLITAARIDVGAGGTWDFASGQVDYPFSSVYGSSTDGNINYPFGGILMFTENR
jgi:hypothetical protein